MKRWKSNEKSAVSCQTSFHAFPHRRAPSPQGGRVGHRAPCRRGRPAGRGPRGLRRPSPRASMISGWPRPSAGSPGGPTSRPIELQGILDEVVRWELEGRPGAARALDLWLRPMTSAFDDPRAAMPRGSRPGTCSGPTSSRPGADGRADDADRGGGRGAGWPSCSGVRHDPVFAAQLAATLGPARVATLLLLQAEFEQHGRAGDAATVERASLRTSVFGLLGVASVTGSSPSASPTSSGSSVRPRDDAASRAISSTTSSRWGSSSARLDLGDELPPRRRPHVRPTRQPGRR